MSRMIELTCPDPKCGYKWQIDYGALQSYKVIYRGDEPRREETYSVPCPNPAHGEKVIIKLSVPDKRK